MTTHAERTPQFTEEEIRAFGNALDRAEIEASEGDPLDDDEAGAYIANQRDVETAKAMWDRIRAGLAPPLPRGAVADGQLRCPNGHSGPFRHQERVWVSRKVHGFNDGGQLVIEGLAEVQWDAAEPGALLHCDACDGEFGAPDVEIEWR